MYMKKYKLFVGCVMPKANAPWIVDTKSRSFDGALRCATTHPTLKVLNIAWNISADLLNNFFVFKVSYGTFGDENIEPLYATVVSEAYLIPKHKDTKKILDELCRVKIYSKSIILGVEPCRYNLFPFPLLILNRPQV